MNSPRAPDTLWSGASRFCDAALRSPVKKSYKKSQQEEAFKELLKLIGANGSKLPYCSMDKLIKKIKRQWF
jgi:hypothetical protein